MGYVLPSGVVNTGSAYFYAQNAEGFGALVKELTDQTLVVLDYSKIANPVPLTSYNFTVDVSSNPALVISYPQLDATRMVLTFLLTGGIAGQQYNVAVATQFYGGSRQDVLTINIPSSQGSCETINPVPQLYTQLPLGTQGYVNTGTRYFWGAAPPVNPTVMDQWYDPTTDTLSEWTTDGTTYFWSVLASTGLVTEAPVDNILYGRYNGYWVEEPIQADAPADGQSYSRGNNSWVPDPIQVDAPSDGNVYGRESGAWIIVPTAAIPVDAPANGKLYGRLNNAWAASPAASTVLPLMNGTAAIGVSVSYSREDHTHPADSSKVSVTGGTMTGPLILSANPSVGLGAATKAYVDSNITAVGNFASTMVPLAGGTMTGMLTLSGNPVGNLDAVTKQYVDTLTNTTIDMGTF
jgi:hypothetical protein